MLAVAAAALAIPVEQVKPVEETVELVPGLAQPQQLIQGLAAAVAAETGLLN
jgi:hypothetical protein